MLALLLHSVLFLGFLPVSGSYRASSLLQVRDAARIRSIRLDYTNRETPSKPGVGDRWVTDGHKSRVSDPAADGPSVISLARRAADLGGDLTNRLAVGDDPAEAPEIADCLASVRADAPPADSALRCLHCPIDENSTPRDGLAQNATLLRFLDGMITHWEDGGNCVYVYDGSNARLVRACALSLFNNELDAPAVLAESGALSMRQGRFVKSFVSARRAAERLQNDMDMVMGGLPKGFL